MNYGELQSRALSTLNYNLSDLNTFVGEWVNQSQGDVMGSTIRWWFLNPNYDFTLEAGVLFYDLPDGVQFLQRASLLMDDGTYWPLQESTTEVLQEMFGTSDAGSPTQWAPDYSGGIPGQIMIVPSPDQVYTVRLRMQVVLTDMVNASDTNFLTDNYSELLICGAVWRGFRYLKDWQQVNAWRGEWLIEFGKLLRAHWKASTPGGAKLMPRLGAATTQYGLATPRTIQGYFP